MFKKSLLTFISELIILFIGIGTTIIINRGLGPVNKGYYAFIILVSSTLSMVLEFGFSTGLSYYSGKKISISTDKWKTLSIVLTLLFFLISTVATFLLILFYDDQRGFFIIPLLFFVQISSKFTLGLYLGSLKIKLFNIIRTLPIFIEITLLISLIILKIKITPINISLIYFFSLFIPLTMSIYFLFPFKFQFPDLKELISITRYSFFIYLANLMSFLNYRIDMFLISFFLKPEYLGWYSVAVFIIEKTRLLSQSTSLVNFALKVNQDVKDSFELSMRIVNTINILVAIFIVITAYPLVTILYSPAYKESIIPMIILAPAILSNGYAKMLSSELSGDGIIKVQLFASIISVMINILLNLVLIPKFKIVGASVASLFSYSLNTFIILIFFLKHYKKSLKNMIIISKTDLIKIKNYFKSL
ncbi:MAG: polysaccharide biosynthesis C-terminal domain-containing protein [candidate division WOR-3 bacterium]